MYNLELENKFYQKCLQHPIYGEIGRKYLESRGINEETIKEWEIGWSPYGCTPTCYKGMKNNFWKKHWGRITFPIRDQHGRIVSISGRLVLKLKNVPKYDHYPFAARRILFGLWKNKENIRKQNSAIITEGQIDVITSWQKGLRNVTSSFGAHCSLDHLALLSRYCNNIDILYDADEAGQEGMEMIKKLSTLGDLKINFRRIFNYGEDLDSWLRKNDVNKLLNLLNRSELDILKNKLLRMEMN